jgi:signal transduction histidine kinase
VLRDTAAADSPAPQPRLDQVPQLVELAKSAGVHVDLVTTGDEPDIPIGVELAAYRIIQEALTNVIRHARATSATVRIERSADVLLVDVTDDGTATVDGHADGHGMIGMRERVRAVGGSFEAGPAPGRGYTVTALLSLGGPR